MINRWKLYDLICDKADKLLKQYNPCNIRIEISPDWLFGKLVCNNTYMCRKRGEDLCCRGCEYKGQNGCFDKCLGCKVSWCWQGDSCAEAFEDDLHHVNIPEIFIHKMDILRRIAYRYGFLYTRTNKEKTFDKLAENGKHPLFYWQSICKPICI